MFNAQTEAEVATETGGVSRSLRPAEWRRPRLAPVSRKRPECSWSKVIRVAVKSTPVWLALRLLYVLLAGLNVYPLREGVTV